MIRSLRVRLMLAAALLALLFMLALLPALQKAFSLALQESIEQRLASDVTTLISAARIERGQLQMPALLPDERYNLPYTGLLGYIFDRQGTLVWQSRATRNRNINYHPRYDGRGNEFARIHQDDGDEFFVYDVEVKLLGGKSAAFSIVALQPVREYQDTLNGLREKLYLGFGAALLALMVLLWAGLTWGLRSLRRLSSELDDVESGARDGLSREHPRELLRLTGSLNRLLRSEREQRQRYRDSLDDLAHSLKTPLAVLQGVGESMEQGDREQARVLQSQIERMSQQIDYQLQRASLRKSGLVKYQVELKPLLDSLCSTLAKVYRDKRVEVSLDIPALARVPMEQGALLELLGNLLENAYRLCLGQVRVSLRQSPGLLELCVEDDGPGVPPDQRERILERGERLDRQHPGQGIGLAVVKDIIDSYDAELSLGDSALGGAAFRIAFRLD
ncbi:MULTISPECIES: ATP-binding protein [Pseudomonas]|uniref:histidine kinase n=1 Tax=Pseudomonas mosselii TaxID=78327 RepID=A0ABX9B3W1_9PSED|nr:MULTISPECIES: ATP-binding protein [Pseudomonas]AMK29882.1 Sensor protein PhoQ [Pseudomonas putida]ATB64263.1 two-component sensor histidine kinase [Pseudomonas mosselii]KXG80006.1 histidine kinase [Pseudomonas mosselii]MBC3451167.1 two-component sensor histidine kinase [Pseudomonas mosselii]MBC3459041.1 two-component sensor histidine kinase [Pseudomonas mosselii]